MNPIEQLIADYTKEYERVNARKPIIIRKGGPWIEIDRNSYRTTEVRNLLTILKSRANFYPL